MLTSWLEVFVVFAVVGMAFTLALKKSKSSDSRYDRDPDEYLSHAFKEPTWEATAVSHGEIVQVYVKRGKTSILIGETDIHVEDFDNRVESLTATAEMRAMSLNSMGIKWDGDVGSMIPADVVDRIREDRDKFQKEVKELQDKLNTIMTPEGYGKLTACYLQTVSPKAELGTIRVMNNGHCIAQVTNPKIIRMGQ